MRNLIAAALVLSPLMAHAQQNAAALPQASSKTSVLQSSVVRPDSLMLSTASATKSSAIRISTGVVAPKLIKTVDVDLNQTQLAAAPLSRNRDIVVSMVVDETGKPSGLKVLHSSDARIDQNVLDAVSKYRFEPGTVSGMPIAVPVDLHIIIQPAGE